MKRTILFLLAYLLLFTVMFGIGVYNYANNSSFLNIGLSAARTNFVMLVLSVLGIIKTAWHIFSMTT